MCSLSRKSLMLCSFMLARWLTERQSNANRREKRRYPRDFSTIPLCFGKDEEQAKKKDALRLRQRAGPSAPAAYGSPNGSEAPFLYIPRVWSEGSLTFHNPLLPETHIPTRREIIVLCKNIDMDIIDIGLPNRRTRHKVYNKLRKDF